MKKLIKSSLLALVLLFINIGKTHSQDSSLAFPSWNSLMRSGNFNFIHITDSIDGYVDSISNSSSFNEEELEGSLGEYIRWKNFWRNRVGKLGESSPDFNAGALSFQNYINSRNNSNSNQSSGQFCNSTFSNWVPLGPFAHPYQHLGKIESVAFSNTLNTMFAGSENSGLYKRDCSNSSNQWLNVTDYLGMPSMGIKDIAIDPINNNNVSIATAIYTGYGSGVFYSSQNGSPGSWTQASGLSNISLNRLDCRKLKYDGNPTGEKVWLLVYDKLFEAPTSTYQFSLNYSLPGHPTYHARHLNDIEVKRTGSGFDPSILVIASDDDNAWNGGALVQLSTNSGSTWNDITPENFIERINLSVSKADPDNIYGLWKINEGGYFKISEISQNISGDGLQTVFSTPINISPGSQEDFIEIANVKSFLSGWALKGYKIERYFGSSTSPESDFTFTDPYNSNNILQIPHGKTVILGWGIGTPIINAGLGQYLLYAQSTIQHSNSDPVGYVLKNDAGAVVDVVCVNGFTFPPGTGINSFYWNGLLPLGNSAAVILNQSDSNHSTDWINSSTGNNLTSFGNEFLFVNNLANERLVFGKFNFSNLTWSNFINLPNAALSRISKNSLQLYVSNVNPSIIYAGGIDLWWSVNAGQSWNEKLAGNSAEPALNYHVDIRDMESAEDNTNNMIFANDGGISKAHDATSQNIQTDNLNAQGLNISEFWSITSPNMEKNKLICGAQHNWAWAYEKTNNPNTPFWTNITWGGDNYKWKFCPMPGSSFALGCGNNRCNDNLPFLGRAINFGINCTISDITPTDCPSADVRPIRFLKGGNSGYFYIGQHDIWKYPDPMTSSQSVNISNFNTQTGICMDAKNIILAFDVCESNPDYIYVYFNGPLYDKDPCGNQCNSASCRRGRFFKSEDNGLSWTDLTGNFLQDDMNSNPITDIKISPINNDVVWITFGGFPGNSSAPIDRVMMTTDGGQTWSDYSNGLPEFPINCIIRQEDSDDMLYVGSDVGVFYRSRNMAQWECFNNNFPTNIIYDLTIENCSQKLRAATYGAGAWESDLAPSQLDFSTIPTGNVLHDINADLIIPAGYTCYINSDINIARGRRIIVQNNGKIKLNNGAHLFNACGEMWDGIYIESGGEIETSHALIENAYSSINLSNGSIYSIAFNEFKNNFIGIQVPNDGQNHSITGSIVDNEFHCPDPLPPYFSTTVQGVTPSTRGLCAIRFYDVNYVKIGQNGYFNNKIHDLENGIIGIRSNIEITSCEIHDISNNHYYNNNFNGSGIFVDGGTSNVVLNYSGRGVNSVVPDIRNCDIGINVRRQDFNISKVLMDGVNKGFIATLCNQRKGYFLFNKINCKDQGITLNQNDNATNLLIKENTINVASSTIFSGSIPGACGIAVGESKSSVGYNNHIEILSNIINIDYGFTGILALATDKIVINGNIIHLNRNNTLPAGYIVSGVALNSCSSVGLYSNSIIGSDNSASSSFTGIEVNTNMGNLNLLKCNNVTNTKTNFVFGGTNASTQLFGNEIGDGFNGLKIKNGCIIGQQLHQGNCFYGIYSDPDGYAGINNNYNPSDIIASQFRVNPFNGICYYPTANVSGMFYPENIFDEYQCEESTSNSSEFTINPEIKIIDSLIALDLINPVQFEEQIKWETRHYLFSKLEQHPELMTGNPLMEDFHSRFMNTNLEYFVKEGFGIVDMNEVVASEALLFQENDSLIKSLVDSLSILDSILFLKPDSALLSSINNTILFINIRIKNLNELNAAILNTYELHKGQIVDSLVTENSEIESNLIYEENIKIVNEIYLKTIAQDLLEFNPDQILALENIANQCPYAGGPGVYHARSLLLIVDPNQVYEDETNCNALGYFRKANRTETEDILRTPAIIPNPVKESATLLYQLPLNFNANCIILDNLGAVQYQFELPENSTYFQFDTGKLMNGIYHFSIYTQNMFVGSGNFAVSR